MKLWKLCLPVVVAVVSCAGTASAGGGFLQKLPKDGTWVRYYVDMKADGPAKQEMSGTMTLKSVGTATEDGEKCRWIEMKFDGEQNGQKHVAILKFLIREKDLADGKKGPPKVLRGWSMNQVGDMKSEAKELTDFQKAGNGEAAMIVGGKLKDAKTLKQEKTIDYQKGQLKIPTAHTGILDVKFAENMPAGFKYNAWQTVWKHKSIPFGAAAVELKVEMHNKEQLLMKMKMSFAVQEYGAKAKSELPDKK